MANSVPSSFNPHPNFFKKESKNGVSSKNSIDSSMLVDMIPLEYLDDKEWKADQNVATIASKISDISL